MKRNIRIQPSFSLHSKASRLSLRSWFNENTIILTFAAFTLTGCGVLKNYDREKVAQPIETSGLYGDAQSGDSLGLGDIKWRELFTDPKLQTLIERVLQQNTDMKNADLAIQQIDYALTAAKWAFAPSINLSVNGNDSKIWDPYQRKEYKNIPNSKTYSVGLTMGWQNVNFLSLRNAKKTAEMSVEQAQAAKQAVQAKLVTSVATLYYTLAELDANKELLEQTKANWAEYLRMQRLLMDAGQVNMAAVASIEATYWSIAQSLVTVEDNIRIIQNQLSTLLNQPSITVDRNSLNTFRKPAIVETGAPLRILARRPDVRMAETALATAFYDVNSAKSAFYPSLSLSATGSFGNSMGGKDLNPGVFIGNAVAGLAQPIFQNGRLRANLRISKAELEVKANQFTNAIINAGNEVNTAMVKVKSAEELREMINNQVNAQQTAYDATLKLFDGSSANYINVITAHNSLLQAKKNQISNRMESISAIIELYLALGGGIE